MEIKLDIYQIRELWKYLRAAGSEIDSMNCTGGFFLDELERLCGICGVTHSFDDDKGTMTLHLQSIADRNIIALLL